MDDTNTTDITHAEDSPSVGLVPADLAESAVRYAQRSMAPRTQKAYQAQVGTFVAWCEDHGLPATPAAPQTVAAYITSKADAGKKVATIAQGLSAIGQAHQLAGLDNPCSSAHVKKVWKGIRRTLGTAPYQKAPVLVPDLRRMVAALPDNLVGVRDRALLLVGFAGAFRRSELVALTVADLELTDDGLVVTIRKSKTDQEGQGRKVGVPFGSARETCPVRSLRAWLEAADLNDGPVFRAVDRHGMVASVALTGRSVARVVKRSAERAGLDPSRFSGHSLRAGLATAAAKAGRPIHAIMAQTGHKSVGMVMTYVREARIFEENAASGIGL